MSSSQRTSSAVLYKLSFPNGKAYIGATKNRDARLRQHFSLARKGGQLPLHKAIRAHGEDSVRISVLAIGPAPYIFDLEIKAIVAVGTAVPDGYNVGLGGYSAPSSSPQAREKIRAAKLAHWKDDAYRSAQTTRMKQRVLTAEGRIAVSAAKKRCWANPDYRAHMSAVHAGFKPSPETITKRAESIRNAWAEGKGREERSAAMRGRLWINDGAANRQLRVGEAMPDGWVRGMLTKDHKGR